MNKGVFFSLSVYLFFVCSSFAEPRLSLSNHNTIDHWPSPPQIINVISGVPLVGAGDNSGGYGDVVANLYAALEIKKRFPKVEVNFLVTTDQYPTDQITPSDQIIQNLLPQLDRHRVDTPQKLHGINFIFIGPKVGDYFTAEQAQKNPHFKKAIPPSDLSIEFSANRSPILEVLKSKSSLYFHFAEFSHAPIRYQHGRLLSGFLSNGIYLTKGFEEADQNHQRDINRWLSDQGHEKVDFAKDEFSIIYNKSAITAEVYLRAVSILAEKTPERVYTLMFRMNEDFKSSRRLQEAFERRPKNLKIVGYKNLPFQVMEKAIAESTFSPFVTGDISLSQAFSSLRAKKALVHEVSSWKRNSIYNGLFPFIESSGADLKKFKTLILDIEEAETSSSQEKWVENKALAMASTLNDSHFLNDFAKKIKPALKKLDIINNSFRAFQVMTLFKRELKIAKENQWQDLDELIHFLLSAPSFGAALKEAEALILNQKAPPLSRLLASLFIIKTRQGLSYLQIQTLIPALDSLDTMGQLLFSQLLVANIRRPSTKLFLEAYFAKDNPDYFFQQNLLLGRLQEQAIDIPNEDLEKWRKLYLANVHPEKKSSTNTCKALLSL